VTGSQKDIRILNQIPLDRERRRNARTRFVVESPVPNDPNDPEGWDVLDTQTGYRAPFLERESAEFTADELNGSPTRMAYYLWHDPDGNPVDRHLDTTGQ
jgi:hypothetical protein